MTPREAGPRGSHGRKGPGWALGAGPPGRHGGPAAPRGGQAGELKK